MKRTWGMTPSKSTFNPPAVASRHPSDAKIHYVGWKRLTGSGIMRMCLAPHFSSYPKMFPPWKTALEVFLICSFLTGIASCYFFFYNIQQIKNIYCHCSKKKGLSEGQMHHIAVPVGPKKNCIEQRRWWTGILLTLCFFVPLSPYTDFAH